MATTVSMPQLGETVTEGTILGWAKQVGDTIAVDEVLVEISTDKVDTEIPSPVAGVILEILAAEGDTVAVGTPMAVIGEASEAGSSQAPPAAPEPATGQPESGQPESGQPDAAPQPAPAPQPEAAPAPAPEPAPAAEAPPAATGSSTTVSMPQLGETVTEGTILGWAKQVGDTIAVDEVLVEISTDKVDTEIPSPVAGVILEILAAEGDTVAVGTPMAVIGEASGAGTPPAPAAAPAPAAPVAAAPAADAPIAAAEAPAAPAAAPAAAPIPEGKFFSPVVRKLAKEHAVDLAEVEGSGKDGRITRKDIESFISRRGPQAAPAPAAAAAPAAAPAPAAATPVSAPAPTSPPPPSAQAPAAAAPAADVPTMAGDRVEDLDRLRARIGENMIKAKQTAAHVWTSVEVDFERVERVRQAHKAEFKATEGFSLTYLPFIARATIDALNEYPVVNSSFYLPEKKAVFHTSVNLGIAIDLNQGGLIVAAIKAADTLRLVGLARDVKTLAEKARSGKLDPADISGSTFTITNPGPFGSFMSAPIINVPNVAILSTDTVTKRATVVTTPDGQDTIAIRHIGYLGLTWDHRAFDGSTAVLFLRKIKENLETWDWEQELT